MTTQILWCGDSTLTGAVRDMTTPPYDFVLTDVNEFKVCTDLLNAHLGACAVESISIAQGGTNCIDWRYGNTERGMPDFGALMYQRQAAKIVVVGLGINDAYNPNISVNDFVNAFSFFADMARQWGKTPVFTTPCPISTPQNARLWEFQNAMKTMARAKGVLVVDHYVAISAVTPFWTQHLPVDGFHPDEDIYRFKGNASYLALLDLVKNLI